MGPWPCRFTQASCDVAQLRLSLLRPPLSSAVLSPVSGPLCHWMLTPYFLGISVSLFEDVESLHDYPRGYRFGNPRVETGTPCKNGGCNLSHTATFARDVSRFLCYISPYETFSPEDGPGHTRYDWPLSHHSVCASSRPRPLPSTHHLLLLFLVFFSLDPIDSSIFKSCLTVPSQRSVLVLRHGEKQTPNETPGLWQGCRPIS